jgi:hypothetical protein
MKINRNQRWMKPALIAWFALAFAGALIPRGVAAQEEDATEKAKSSGAPSNRVLALDGEKGFMQVSNSPSLHTITNSLTLEAWCLAYSFYPRPGSVNSILRKNVQADAENFFLRIRNTAGPPLIEMSLGSQVGVMRAPAELKTNQWYHLAGTYDGTTVTIYVNGVKIKSELISGNFTIDASDLIIGRGDPEFSSGEYFHGMLDEIRLWNVARSPAEIQATLNAFFTGKEKGLVAYWSFNDGTADDLSGHGNNGQIQGNARIIEAARPTISPR